MSERLFTGDLQELLSRPQERVSLLRQILAITVQKLPSSGQVEWIGGFGSFFDPTNPTAHDVDLAAQVAGIHPEDWLRENEVNIQAAIQLQLGLNCQLLPFDIKPEDKIDYASDQWSGFIHNLTDLYGTRPVWLSEVPTRDFLS